MRSCLGLTLILLALVLVGVALYFLAGGAAAQMYSNGLALCLTVLVGFVCAKEIYDSD